jgi:hypothetical protein
MRPAPFFLHHLLFMNMVPHLYQPLQHGGSIRILVLHPSLNDSYPILCTILHAQLYFDPLEYEALSYTWGSTDKTSTIQFDNGKSELQVTQNCYDALRRLRRKHTDRQLWVDAICIDQQNLTERASQVRIMDEIFSCASSVVVFLGEQVTECRALFAELAAVDETLSLGEHPFHSPPSDAIVELDALYDLPWFKRVWVLQEVCAKKSVMFMYGSAIASSRAIKALHYGYKNTSVTKAVIPLPLRWIHAISCPFFSRPQINLWQLLFWSRDCLATDPKDKVFALKSLTGVGQSELNSLIDYKQSVEDCFTQVATFLLPVLGLRLLLAVRHPHRLKMPSWAPDWSQSLPLYGEECSDITPADELKFEIRPIPGTYGMSSIELLVTGCRYARIVSKSCVFSFACFEDSKTQMQTLYHNFSNLRKYVKMERTHDDFRERDILGRRIVDGE